MTMQLFATSVSSAVLSALRNGGEGEVLGVYEHSLNLAHGDEVISIVATEVDNLPMGILADPPYGRTWKEMSIRPGLRVVTDGNTLSMSPHLKIDLGRARRWESVRQLGNLRPSANGLRAALPPALAALQGAAGLAALGDRFDALLAGEIQKLPGGSPINAAAAAKIGTMMRALNHGDSEGFLGGALGLVGLGIGLTPSGDDLLTGLVGTLLLFGENAANLRWVAPAAGQLAQAAEGLTTRVGLTYIRCASRGEITERHEGLVRALAMGDAMGSGDACRRLRAFGHSSGGEIAFGTLLAAGAAARMIESPG